MGGGGSVNGRGKDGRSWRRLLKSCEALTRQLLLTVAGGAGGGVTGASGGAGRDLSSSRALACN